MISKDALKSLVESKLVDTDYYLVDIRVSANNEIKVEIDADNGVDIDFCIALTRFIESNFDREVEDYELEVGSAGLTAPFKILRQYQKNIGNDVEVLTAGGKKHCGVLVSADENEFVVEETLMLRKVGDKRKKPYTEQVRFGYDDVKSVKYDLKF